MIMNHLYRLKINHQFQRHKQIFPQITTGKPFLLPTLYMFQFSFYLRFPTMMRHAVRESPRSSDLAQNRRYYLILKIELEELCVSAKTYKNKSGLAVFLPPTI